MQKFLVLSLFFGSLTAWAADSDRSPFDLLEEARLKGEITSAETVLYNALAMWGDSSLPAQYRGNPSTPPELVSENDLHTTRLAHVMDELSPQEQRQALRLVAPPAYVQGIADGVGLPADGDLPAPHPDPNWLWFETTETKVWYLFNDPNGERYAKAIRDASPEVIRKLTTLMGRGPLPDDGESYEYKIKGGKTVTIGNGGNNKIDIYIIPINARNNTTFRAYAASYKDPETNAATPGFIVFDSNKNLPDRRVKSILMHEMMHLVQFAFPKVSGHVETYPVGEGTAKWSEDHWDSSSQYEHDWNLWARHGWISLKAESYATWTFYYYLVHELSSDLIQGIYSAMSGKHPYEAVDAALPGGFKKVFPDFARKEWNQLPNEESFLEWDSFPETPYESKAQEVQVKPILIQAASGDFRDKKEFTLLPLTRKYLAYSIPAGTDVRSFSVSMAHFFQKDQISLKALVQYESKGWKVEDWNSQMQDKELCFDMKDERIKKIVLIYTNFDHKDGGSVDLRTEVKSTNLGCFAYKGKVTGSMKTGSGTSYSSITTDANVWFEAESRDSKGGGGTHMPGRFNLTSLQVGYTYNAQSGDCTASKSETLSFAGPTLKKIGTIGLYPYHTTNIPNGRMLNGAIQHPLDKPIPVTFYCPRGRTYTGYFYIFPWLIGNYGAGYIKIAPGSGVIQGSGPVMAPQAGQDVQYTYRLEPFAQ